MNKKAKRALCSIISALMLISAACMPAMAEGERIPTSRVSAVGGPLIEVTFDETDNLPYTLHGNAVLADGRNGKALSLSGDSQYADISSIADDLMSVDGDFTISVWFKPDTITTWSRVYDFGNGSSGTYAFLTPSNGSAPRLAVTTSGIAGEQQVNASDAISAGDWHNITITREKDLSVIYVDGFFQGSTTDLTYKFSEIGKMQNYYLGKSQFNTDPYFRGMIDDFCVYDEALSETEIQELAGEAYESRKKLLIYENNCFIMDTHFYKDDTELFAIDDSVAYTYITDKNITDSSASFKLFNTKSVDAASLKAYAAEYDKDGVFKSVIAVKSFTDDDLKAGTADVSIPYSKNNAEDTVRLFVWENLKPVSEEAPSGSIKAVMNIKNYTSESGNVTAAVYSVSDDGTETAIIDAVETVNFNSLDEKDIEIEIPVSKIPSNAKKLAVNITTPGDETNTAASLYSGISAPVAAPADSDSTTNGAHDPSIVKFPGDDTYYVYSSHHLIFTSKDLINWKKYDFSKTDAKDISPRTYSFISSNYQNTTMNDTYWAPDVIYKEGDAHPYWMYISVSCGLGGRNSAISLMKSDSPLFWADRKADIVDAGVVFATKENSSYKTNAIDANIYTDTSDNNKQYFVWGSFWGGIQAAPLTAEGFVEGINYTSDAAILSSCQNFGTSVFTQKNGVAGPEGAWLIEHSDYRYMFTSYGWLGSNYNTRIARAPLGTKFSADTGTQLTDANKVVMGREYSAGSTSKLTGYKLIGSYRLGGGAETMTHDTSNNEYYYALIPGSAHVYYGPGHNSAINIGDESFYVSHIRKDAIEGAGVLQVRKMLFTADGWPVVSPVTYAGEKEQALPKEMLYGTYDLASVGQTKMDGTAIYTGTNPNRNYDLPVLSSKVTLNEDGTLANGLGTWSFDDDHTITVKFTKDGDQNKDEFYKSGDTLTLYALYGYDKDEKIPVIALTGTDQNHITQFAKKQVNYYKTEASTIAETEPVSIAKSAGGNPELGFDDKGNTIYAGDPAAMVDGDTVYLYVGRDSSTSEVTDTNAGYVMPGWLCYSSKNMTDWKYEGEVLSCSDVSWASNKNAAWASQAVKYNGTYYLYFCTWDSTDGGKQSIGVATSKSPTGPFVDKGTPLIKGSFTMPESSGWNDIDPTVLIDTVDGVEHRYLAWGNGKYYICELNEDMVSVKDLDGDGELVMHKDIKERVIKSKGDQVYTEAPWLYKRDGKYYMFFAINWREEMAYAMMDTPMGRYDYKQTIMPPTATSNTNHPSVIDFNGKTYFIYHNGALPWGFGFRRSVCIQELEFDENGYVYPLTETSVGLTGTASTIKTADGRYIGHEAFRNSLADADYPISKPVNIRDTESEYNTAWEILAGRSVPSGANADNYVSLQSADKPGLYITSTGSSVRLMPDYDNKSAAKMTFKTVKGLDGSTDSVSFESVSDPGRYLTVLDKELTLSYGTVAADSSFTIGEVTTKPNSEINIADIEPDAQAEADITQDFNNTSIETLISLNSTDTPAYTALKGVTLYIGTRSGGGAPSQNFSIQSGGVSGNALVLNAGAYQSASRAPRMKIYTPPIPDGYTVTASLKVKLVDGSGGASKLYYNDSETSVDDNKGNLNSGTYDTNLTADNQWHTLKFTIENDDEVYTRKTYIDDAEIRSDYVNTFPVLWGTIANGTSSSVYFDDLSIKTTDKTGNTPVIALPSPAAKFEFENNLTDSVSGESGTLTGSKISLEPATDQAASFVDGKDGGKAVSLSGQNSYGVSLPAKPSGSSYTISFDIKINESTQFTPYLFMINYNGSAPKGGDDDAQWISIAPQGWLAAPANGPMIWSRNVADLSSANPAHYYDLYNSSSDYASSVLAGEWHSIAVTAKGKAGALYVDKELVASGDIADIIDSTTKLYLGVNDWDTPLNGAIDNLMIFNQTLSASQIALIE